VLIIRSNRWEKALKACIVSGTEGSIGWDLHSAHDLTIQNGGTGIVSTDIALFPPPGTYVRIAPRSGLSATGVLVGAGVVDPDYEGISL